MKLNFCFIFYRHFELSDQRQFPCKICGKLFKDPSGLSSHEKIHTGERSHVCSVCAKAFLTNASLKIHKVSINSFLKSSHTGKSNILDIIFRLRCHSGSSAASQYSLCHVVVVVAATSTFTRGLLT